MEPFTTTKNNAIDTDCNKNMCVKNGGMNEGNTYGYKVKKMLNPYKRTIVIKI